MSMIVEKVDVNTVRNKLASLKNGSVLGKRSWPQSSIEEVPKIDSPEPQSREEEPQLKDAKKEIESEFSEDEDAALLRHMGLPCSFK